LTQIRFAFAPSHLAVTSSHGVLARSASSLKLARRSPQFITLVALKLAAQADGKSPRDVALGVFAPMPHPLPQTRHLYQCLGLTPAMGELSMAGASFSFFILKAVFVFLLLSFVFFGNLARLLWQCSGFNDLA